jgi:hypothetical protein
LCSQEHRGFESLLLRHFECNAGRRRTTSVDSLASRDAATGIEDVISSPVGKSVRVGSSLALVVLVACSSGGTTNAVGTPMLGSASTQPDDDSSSGDPESESSGGGGGNEASTTGAAPPPGCKNGVVEVGELCFFELLYTEGIPGASWIVSTSFDGDAHEDLAVAAQMQGAVYVLFGDGEGNFLFDVFYEVGTDAAIVATGALDGWALPDLVTANRGDSSLSVLLNDGTGQFGAATSIGVYAAPSMLLASDFTNDGLTDLAVAHDDDMARVTIMLGSDAGLTQAGVLAITGGDAIGITADDVDGDAIVDLVLGLEVANEVVVMKGDGAGGFIENARAPSGGEYPLAVRTLDLDGDGGPEIVVANAFPSEAGVGNLQIIEHDGVAWTAGQLVLTEGAGALDFGDFDADSDPDVVLSTGAGGSVQVFVNDGAGALGVPETFVLDPAGEPFGVLAADFDENGAWDIAAADPTGSRLAILMSEN